MLKFKNFAEIFIVMILLPILILPQHRGDNLSFQGLFDNPNGTDAKIAAMGGANIAGTGELGSIFNNPAGLASIHKIKFSFTANEFEKRWWENQDYRPNRQFVTLSFYLDGLYAPNPANNGKWDNQAFFDDSTYIVNDPQLGLDPFSEEAANWINSESGRAFNNIAVVVPLKILEHNFVISAAYSKQFNILDYDRNNTYLDPHLGYNGYGPVPERVTSAEDSIRVNWFDYERSKIGKLNQITLAFATGITESIDLGVKVNLLSGSSNDSYKLNKIGYFDLMGGANQFKFAYDTLNTGIKGTSNYSAFSITVGSVFKLNRFNLGVSLNLPYTLKKEWSYTKTVSSVDSTSSAINSGVDELSLPLTYAVGLAFMPIDEFTIRLDVEKSNLSNSKLNMASPDSTLRKFPNKTSIRVGAEYKIQKFLSILFGYNYQNALFVPDGAAIKDKGPGINSYSFGVSILLPIGRFNIAYTTSSMRYYDSYFSNTNYNTVTNSNILVGYTYTLN